MSPLPALLLLLALALSSAGPALPRRVRAGLNLDPCTSSSECVEPRRCNFGRCISRDTLSCENASECTAGEICIPNPFSDDDGLACISAAAAGPGAAPPAPDTAPSPPAETAEPESPEPSAPEGDADAEDEVCVDAAALAHLPASDLVYAVPRVARVLCDAAGSCATRGHIVVWRGVAMMMRSYCREVPCQARTIKVNAPRYRRRLRVASSTPALHFTALAARYETAAEERALHLAVRLGW